MSGNLFAAAPAVIAELREKLLDFAFDVDGDALDPLKVVESFGYLSGQPNLLPFAPGMFVTLDSTDAESPMASGRAVQEKRRLIVSVVVPNIPTSGALSTESAAGAYAYQVVRVLKGFQPGLGHGPLKYAGAGLPVFYKSGTAEFPLYFECQQTITEP